MSPAVLQLLVANIAMYVVQTLSGGGLILTFALWPVGEFPYPGVDGLVGFHPWQLITYAFLHDPGSIVHLLLNMFALFMFGRDVEMRLGTRRFLVLYFAAVLTAGLVQLWVVTANAPQDLVPTLGASGGVFGVLLAFGVLFPKRRVFVLPIPVPIPAWLLVLGYAAIELTSGVFGTFQGVAHFAHLGGMIGAGIVLLVTLARPRVRRRYPE
jgi:membrane associated rhomboid family serine protease